MVVWDAFAALDNVCVYRDSDDVHTTYRRLMDADVLVLAGAMRDRYLSSRWKLFFDRGFFHNHVPMFVGKQMAYLISGPLLQNANLRQMLEAYAQLQQANLAGIVSDDRGDGAELDAVLDGLAHRLLTCARTGYLAPPTFLGVAGHKLFRDAIWGSLRFVFHADHRYYKRHGLYDFPRRGVKRRVTDTAVRLLTLVPRFRREFLQCMKSGDDQATGKSPGARVSERNELCLRFGLHNAATPSPFSQTRQRNQL